MPQFLFPVLPSTLSAALWMFSSHAMWKLLRLHKCCNSYEPTYFRGRVLARAKMLGKTLKKILKRFLSDKLGARMSPPFFEKKRRPRPRGDTAFQAASAPWARPKGLRPFGHRRATLFKFAKQPFQQPEHFVKSFLFLKVTSRIPQKRYWVLRATRRKEF